MKLITTYSPAVLTIIMLVILVFLGNWQIERLSWKQALIKKISAQKNTHTLVIDAASDLPAPAHGQDAFAQDTLDYRKIILVGRFDHSKTQYWFSQIVDAPAGIAPQDRIGFHLIAPFYLQNGGAVLVDRGFIPQRLRTTLSPNHAPPDESAVIRLATILRIPGPRTYFDPQDQPQDNLFYVRAPRKIAAHINIDVPPYIFDAVRNAKDAGSWPLGGQTRFVLPNNHLHYALTWYSLALVLVIVSAKWHINVIKARA